MIRENPWITINLASGPPIGWNLFRAALGRKKRIEAARVIETVSGGHCSQQLEETARKNK